MNIGSRIKYLRKEKLNLTQSEFAEKIGLKQATIGLYESGKRNVLDRVVTDICREFSVNEDWIRTGKGDMFIEISKNENDEAKQMLIKILQNQNDMKELLNSKSNKELSNQFLTDLSKVFNIISPEHAKKLTDHLAPYIFGFLTACNEEYMDKLMFLIKATKY